MNAQSIQKTPALRRPAREAWLHLQVRVTVRCADSRAGRMLLHLLCACADHQVRWHWQGIARELAGQALASRG